jgi:hypothetical protein
MTKMEHPLEMVEGRLEIPEAAVRELRTEVVPGTSVQYFPRVDPEVSLTRWELRNRIRATIGEDKVLRTQAEDGTSKCDSFGGFSRR